MVVLDRTYARTGDGGTTTSLGNGARCRNYDLRIVAYGTRDEANAAIGLARLRTVAYAVLDGVLTHIQNDSFAAAADLPLATS
jgi:cob(I)alamin adenosyltransferase